MLSQNSVWSKVCIVIALAGFALRADGLAWKLPYQLDPDEPLLFVSALEIRAAGPRSLKPHYSPLRIYELVGEQVVIESVSGGAARQDQLFFFGRAFSALYSVLLLAVAFQLGRRLHSPAAGALTALFLAVEPTSTDLGRLIRADAFAWLLALASLLLCVVAVERRSNRWLAVSFALAVAACLAKYNMAPVLSAPAFVLVFQIARGRRARLALLAGAAALLLTGIILLRTSSPVQTFLKQYLYLRRLTDVTNSFPDQVSTNIRLFARDFGKANLVLAVAGLGLARQAQRRAPAGRLKLGALMISAGLAAAIYTQADARFHDMYYLALVLALFWGIGLATAARWFQRTSLKAGFLVAAIALLVGPWVRTDLERLGKLRLPDTQTATAEWLRRNVPEGARVACEYDCVELQPGYGGFPGPQPFHTEVTRSIYDRTPLEYQTNGIEYLIADSRASGLFANQAGRTCGPPDASQVCLEEVARFQGGDYVGPDRVIVRVPPIQQHALYRWIGDAIAFRGYDLPRTRVPAGGELSLTLYWMSAKQTRANYVVFVHLAKDAASQPVAQWDSPPLNGTHPTWQWAGDMQFWKDPRTVPIPAGAPAGRYVLQIGIYDADTGVRLPVRSVDGVELGTTIPLGEVTITP